MKRIAIDTDAELSSLCDVFCECLCDSEAITFDRDSQTVTIPFEREMREECVLLRRGLLLNQWMCPIKQLVLTVHHVVNCDVQDDCQIGRIDLATIEYNSESKKIMINPIL